MIAPELISDTIPPLHLDDSGEHALMLMQEYNVSQLPVLDAANKYSGFITMEEIIHIKHLSTSLKSFQIQWRAPFVLNTAHIFDVMRAAVDFNIKIVPVVDEHSEYIGVVSAESCLRAFALLNSVKDAGATIEVEITLQDYTLSEVARIAEDNNANILCLYTNIKQETATVELTIKLNTTDVAGMVATFERFEYVVKGVYNDVKFTEELKDRYDALMRYLNV